MKAIDGTHMVGWIASGVEAATRTCAGCAASRCQAQTLTATSTLGSAKGGHTDQLRNKCTGYHRCTFQGPASVPEHVKEYTSLSHPYPWVTDLDLFGKSLWRSEHPGALSWEKDGHQEALIF